MGEPVFVVVNPQAGQGRGARLLGPVLAALAHDGPVEHAASASPGDEAAITRQALARGFRTLVAVGGDGTWSNVGNAIVSSRADARLALVAGGTGCDLAKSLDVPARDPVAAARLARDGAVRRIDAGRLGARCFFNIAGFGYDVAVLEHARRLRFLRGDLLYLYCALRQVRSFPGFDVELEADGEALGRRHLLMLILANARHFGGAFSIAPQAALDDGRIDAVAFGDASTWRRWRLIGALLRGRHARAPEVSLRAASRYRLKFDAPPAYEIDGELNQATATTLEVECVPGALALMVPRRSDELAH